MVASSPERPKLVEGGDHDMLYVDGRWIVADEVAADIDSLAADLAALPTGLLLLGMRSDYASILTYLAAFQSGRAVALLDPGLPDDTVEGLVRQYRPAVVAGYEGAFNEMVPHPSGWQTAGGAPAAVNERLAVMLPTSGSTGSPRMVRLSRSAVLSNATSIAQALGIGPGECAPTSLPLFSLSITAA